MIIYFDFYFKVYLVRSQLGEKPTSSELSGNTLQSVPTAGETDALYIIIDTNVFLSNLPFIEEVRDSRSDKYGRPFIVIPWTVIQVHVISAIVLRVQNY